MRVDAIEQTYPGVRALDGVMLTLNTGQVMGLLGENGAGKSTLIRILGGIEKPVGGKVYLRGKEVDFHSALDSQAAGISVVSQEFRLVPQLSVADNIFLGHELTKTGVVNAGETRRRTRELLDLLALRLDPDELVENLSLADQQMVEIARALSHEFDLLILDEPTAALNGPEVDRLLEIVGRLAEQGKSIIYVSHRLDEVFQVCDAVTVFRDGATVWEGPVSSLNEDTLIEHMLGRKPVSFVADRKEESLRSSELPEVEPVLSVRSVEVDGLAAPIDMEVYPGEIVGLAGLAGSGRNQFMRALYGDANRGAGEISVRGERVRLSSPHAAVSSGLFMLSEDRKQTGILPHLDVTENTAVSSPRGPVLSKSRYFTPRLRERKDFEQLKTKMRIRVPSGRELIGNLSGGNQQKVMFARAVTSSCDVLLLNEPTRGVDIGAKVEIYELIQQLASEGKAVIVSSSDVPELVAVANRCLVFYAGKVTAELTGDNISEDSIISSSVGLLQEVNNA